MVTDSTPDTSDSSEDRTVISPANVNEADASPGKEGNNVRRSNLLQPGDLFEGRYTILALLGKGAMGAVYKAKDGVLDRLVALKVIAPNVVLSSELVQRMQIEARALSRLDHPNLLRIYDFGVIANTGSPFLVMEYVRGLSLSEVLELEHMLDPKRCARLFMGLCDGLIHAHYNEIIHRDLKPSNCMLSLKDNELLKILDFGIAKLGLGYVKAGSASSASDIESGATDIESGASNIVDDMKLTNGVIGTPNYMSPEQFEGKPADRRSDQYALGCMIFECLTGKPPMVGLTWVQTCYMRMLEELPLQDIPVEFCDILRQLLARDPSKRFNSISDLRDALDKIARTVA
jgi:eukaryotic-like serine/threonine-protein kinase